MSSDGSVSRWLNRLLTGDRNAVQPLWELYFHRLVTMARQKLRDLPRTVADEEDVALSAFDSFCRRAEQGKFPRLDDRNDLWQVLLMITGRKACDLIEHERREKRDRRRAQSLDAADFREPPSAEPDPAAAVEVAEETRRLLGLLKREQQRVIAVRKLEGYTNEETAAMVGCALSTVERELKLIRRYWKNELPE